MSRWHALQGVQFGLEADGIDLEYWPVDSDNDLTTILTDALADPNGDDLADQQVMLLPQGPAWGTPDGQRLPRTTDQWKFWRAVAELQGQHYRDLWRVALAATSLTQLSALADYELDYGLPGPCPTGADTNAKRYRWLRFRVTSPGTITPGDFLNLARRLGVRMVIEEPQIFEMGGSELGGPFELGTPESEHLVVFHILDGGEYGFVLSESELGATPLYDFDQAGPLECWLKRLVPIGFDPIFDYSSN